MGVPHIGPAPSAGSGGAALPAGGPGQLVDPINGGTPVWQTYPVVGRQPDDTPVNGRTWETSFNSAEEDGAIFDISPLWQRATDANGLPVLRLANSTFLGDRTLGSAVLANVTIADGVPIIGGEGISGGFPGGATVLATTAGLATADVNTVSNVLTNVQVKGGTFAVGQTITGAGIPASTTITAATATTLTLSNTPTVAGTGVTITTTGSVWVSAAATGATTAGVTITLTREVPEATLFTKSRDLRDCEVLIKYLPKSTTSQSAAYARAYGRYAGPNNFMRGRKLFNSGNPVVSVEAMAQANSLVLTGASEDIVLNIPRWLRVRVEADAIFLKSWFAWTNWRGTWSSGATYAAGDGVVWNDGAGQGPSHNLTFVAVGAVGPSASNPSVDTANWKSTEEPDWQYIRRARGATGASSTSSTIDNCDIGSAGLGFQRLTVDVYEFSVVELVKRQTNILWRAQARHIETVDNVPVGWSINNNPSGGNTVDVVDVALPGDSLQANAFKRRAFHFLHTVAQGNFWAQTVYNARQPGATANSPRRSRKHPQAVLGRAFRISGWSKGTNIVDQSPSTNAVSASCDVYHYARNGTATSSTDGVNSLGSYFFALGPDGPLGHGAGTWDWYFFEFWLVLQAETTVVRINPQFGLHDASTGELWVCDPQIEPVA